jgi:hypothetical protein
MFVIRTTFAGFLIAAALPAGILVSRSEKGLEFTAAASIQFNAKDKALSLGSQPKLSAPLNKLPNIKIDGTLLNSADAHIVALEQDGALTYLLPENLPKAPPADPAAIWKTAAITYKKAANDKAPTAIPADAFVAFLPGGPEQLASLCKDSSLLEIVAGKEHAFTAQLQYIAAAVKAFPADPAIAGLERFVEQAMRSRFDSFESGAAGTDVLATALQFADLSQALYPAQPAQAELRKSLRDRKGWLDRKTAVLRAFAAAGEWDAFLLGDRDFERYQRSFPQLAERHAQALLASLDLHKRNAEQLTADREYQAAWREFHLASLRRPSDKLLQQSVMMAWTDYSRAAAIDRQGRRKQLTAGQQNVIAQQLLFATKGLEAKKFDEALQNVQQAEAVDPESLPVLLKKAEVLGALHEFNQAFDALDRYDLHAIEEERAAANKLRGELLYQRVSAAQESKAQFGKAWFDGSFHKAYDVALQGLRAQDNDSDLLYDAGLAAAVVRDPKASRQYFARYLEIANNLDAKPEQRVKVRSILPTLADAPAATTGAPNWLSGAKLPPGVFYDPVSLAFQPRIDRIEASGKFHVSFDWDGDRLRAIVPTFEKVEQHPTGERKIAFAYDTAAGQVNAVAYEQAKSFASADPDEMYRNSALVLSNNPYIDPAAVERFTEKNYALGIAGNKYFDPFVWDHIHYFRFTYDAQGHVAQAREVADPKAAPGDTWLEFEWDDNQLQTISAFQGADAAHRAKLYERTLQYQDGRLVSEEIKAQGKTSHIKYNYNAGRLVSATCDRDPSLDDRSRQVTFR